MEQGYNNADASGCIFFSILSSQLFHLRFIFIEMELLQYYNSDRKQNPSVDQHLSSFKVKCFSSFNETHGQKTYQLVVQSEDYKVQCVYLPSYRITRL